MADDIVTWQLDASAQRAAVTELRVELSACAQNDRAFSIARFFELLPVTVANKQTAIARGDIRFSSHRATNPSVSATSLVVADPALGQFNLNVPMSPVANVAQIPDGGLRLDFTGDLCELEIPSLAQHGFDRSIYQKIERIDLTQTMSMTYLRDSLQPNKVTILAVHLTQTARQDSPISPMILLAAYNAGRKLSLRQKIQMASLLDSPCGSQWHVIRRKGTTVCQAYQGSGIATGHDEWDNVHDAQSEDDANNWIKSNNGPGKACEGS